ncbi:hypothetical protein BDR04DRAFT_1097583 [Suillus decipiens]|nr:hypothetical protein BDR04DRAFT_1097583 [Suillus decipiens]
MLSEIITTLFTISVKEALRHRMPWPISLVQLSTDVVLTKGTCILRPEYWLTILTLYVFGVLRLLTAGYRWTTLLTPTYFLWPIEMQGSELDIPGTALSTLLSEDYLNQGLTTRTILSRFSTSVEY